LVLRKCPYCGASVSPWSILGPCIKGGDNKVECNTCGNTISRSMKLYSWIGLAFGLPIGLLLDDIVKFLFGINIKGNLQLTFYAVLIFIVIVLVSAYYLLPIGKHNSVRRE